MATLNATPKVKGTRFRLERVNVNYTNIVQPRGKHAPAVAIGAAVRNPDTNLWSTVYTNDAGQPCIIAHDLGKNTNGEHVVIPIQRNTPAQAATLLADVAYVELTPIMQRDVMQIASEYVSDVVTDALDREARARDRDNGSAFMAGTIASLPYVVPTTDDTTDTTDVLPLNVNGTVSVPIRGLSRGREVAGSTIGSARPLIVARS